MVFAQRQGVSGLQLWLDTIGPCTLVASHAGHTHPPKLIFEVGLILGRPQKIHAGAYFGVDLMFRETISRKPVSPKNN